MDVPERNQSFGNIITLRTTHSDLFNASSQFTWKVSYNDWDNGRTLTLKAVNGKQLHVYANFTNASIDYTIPEGTWYLYLENGNPVEGEKKISVPAHEFRLYTNFAE